MRRRGGGADADADAATADEPQIIPHCAGAGTRQRGGEGGEDDIAVALLQPSTRRPSPTVAFSHLVFAAAFLRITQAPWLSATESANRRRPIVPANPGTAL